jgi:ASCH domain
MGFQFKKELAEKIARGLKTQTRRPFKEGDHFRDLDTSTLYRKGRKQWAVGQRYAVQPGRGKKGIGFIEVTQIRYEDVREISQADAMAEGFKNRIAFLQVWTGFYDPSVTIVEGLRAWHLTIKGPGNTSAFAHDLSEEDAIAVLMARPAALYQAWAITFTLVPEEAAVQS